MAATPSPLSLSLNERQRRMIAGGLEVSVTEALLVAIDRDFGAVQCPALLHPRIPFLTVRARH